jgi:glycosyltransferase involved in cell wall biosynthesis
MIRVLVLVNGYSASAAAMRAAAIVERLGPDIHATTHVREGGKAASIVRFLREAVRFRPDVTYVVDMAYSGVLAAGAYRLVGRNRMIVDTGDAIFELAKSIGERGRIGLWMTDRLERFGFWVADAIVVRGTKHRELLGEIGKPVVVVQDGVDTDSFRPVVDMELRSKLASGGAFTIGLVGSSVWSDRLGICYGWELVEVVHALRHRDVVGVMIGGGTGIGHLHKRCAELGIEDRVRFVGYVSYDDLPRYLGAMDVCLSTQTNDVPGRVRTTGKLPLYLAAGGVILASDVGEAGLVVDPRQRVEYEGVVDRDYPSRLAERIGELMDDGAVRSELIAANRRIARERFEYRELAERVRILIEELRSAAH